MLMNNNKLVTVNGIYHDAVKKDWDINAIVDDIIINPIMTPAVAGSPVTITDSKGQPININDVRQHIIDCCGDGVNTISETFVKDLLGQSLLHFNKKTDLSIVELFAIQAGTEAGLDEPDAITLYTLDHDVIPTIRNFFATGSSYNEMFASLAYYARPETLGFYFLNEIVFDNFVQWFTGQMNSISNMLTPETNRLVSEFSQLKLNDLTESLILRKDNADSLEPLSFSRLLINMLMQNTNIMNNNEFGILPFNLSELICPKTVVFVNIEKHAKASAHKIKEEWSLIDNALHRGWQKNMISNKKLNKLTAVDKKLKKIQYQAVTAANNKDRDAEKMGKIIFKKSAPTSADIVRSIKKLLDKMAFVNTSMNTYKQTKMSFAKPNRRDPDDFNKQGKITSTKYKPDIHIYIDTSGSISERDYRDAVKACIALARKYNINMYFNSFSHKMSQTTKLNLQGKSVAQIYKEFQKIPKVSGGTDYEQIWRFINSSKKRTRELSILITDFEYTANTHYCRHPKNLFYFPCSTVLWDRIKYSAEMFCKSMLHNDSSIRRHIMF